MAGITIFHTSDLHNKLKPEMAAYLRDLKASVSDSLLLDSGDAIWAGNIFWRPGGEPVLDLMNDAGYDAMCMGNREFHFTETGALAKTDRARFPVLSANLRPSREGVRQCGDAMRRKAFYTDASNLPTKPYVIFNRAGVNIGVFGLSVPCITEKMLSKRVSDYYFIQPLAAAEELVPELRSQCDVLIALSHIGISRDREIADKVDGIDLILGGHTHALTEEPEKIGNTIIAHHGAYGQHIGRIDIDIEQGQVNITQKLIPLEKA